MKTATTCLFAVATLAIFGGSFVASITTNEDMCGDPLPTDAMRQNPQQVLDWLKQRDMTQKVNKMIDQHPFVVDAENGKLDKRVMQQFVVNEAYQLERMIRSIHGAQNRFGFTWPDDARQGRDFLNIIIDYQRDLIDDLAKLGAKFDIADVKNLIAREPNYVALMAANALTDASEHAQDVAEVIAPCVVVGDHQMDVARRLKKALATNSAYKAWNLSDDDLRFFDRFNDYESQRGDMERMVNAVLRRAIDRDITLCQLRRRLEAVNIGRLAFLDATVGRYDPARPSDDRFEVGY